LEVTVFPLKIDLRHNNIIQFKSMYLNSVKYKTSVKGKDWTPDRIWDNDVSKGSNSFR